MITALVTKYLGAAFDGPLQDAVKPFQGERVGVEGEYDVETGTTPSSTISYTGRGVFDSYNDYEIQSTQIDITDVKLTCLQEEVTNTPIIDDVIIAQGIRRSVINISPDPADATWVIQLRGLGNVGY